MAAKRADMMRQEEAAKIEGYSKRLAATEERILQLSCARSAKAEEHHAAHEQRVMHHSLKKGTLDSARMSGLESASLETQGRLSELDARKTASERREAGLLHQEFLVKSRIEEFRWQAKVMNAEPTRVREGLGFLPSNPDSPRTFARIAKARATNMMTEAELQRRAARSDADWERSLERHEAARLAKERAHERCVVDRQREIAQAVSERERALADEAESAKAETRRRLYEEERRRERERVRAERAASKRQAEQYELSLRDKERRQRFLQSVMPAATSPGGPPKKKAAAAER